MAIVKSAPGAILSGTFDRAAADVAVQLKAFRAALEVAQKRQGFKTFVQSILTEGSKVTINIFPAETPIGSKAKPAPIQTVQTKPAKVGWGSKP